MPSQVIHRDVTPAEQALLQKALATTPYALFRWKWSALLLWLFYVVGLVCLSLAFFALVFKLFNSACGSCSPAVAVLLRIAIFLLACAIYIYSVRRLKSRKNSQSQLLLDIASSRVDEERYVFTETKRFQEDEHGGLMYFLHTDDDKVLVLYDGESQDLGVQNEDPLKSSFKPCRELVMVRAPVTRFVISATFSGATLEASDPIPLTIAPAQWPESEELCDIPWHELESKLCPDKTWGRPTAR